MSSGERSPKRQRLESYSPASPPLTADTKAFVPPQTPPPSVRMSPSWQSQSQSNSTQNSGTGGNFPTPPSTAGFQSHMYGRDTGGDSARHTPASEGEIYARKDGDGDAEMTDRHDFAKTAVTMAEGDHRRTDHEREGDTGDASTLILGVQVLYKVATAPVEPCQPHLSEDLIELYGLKPIQASVARRDPVTGEKINKLRKSYENKVKALGLEGRNKATSNKNELQGLLDPGWDMINPNDGLTNWDGKYANLLQEKTALGDLQSQTELFSKLDSALSLPPGRLPPKEHKEWQNILGLDDASIAAKPSLPAQGRQLAGATHGIANTAPPAHALSSAPSSPHNSLIRPGRTGAKRRYDDSSFEGYTGYDEDGSGRDESGRRGSNAKRQKRKEFSASSQNSPAFSDTATTSGGNMVGVRSS